MFRTRNISRLLFHDQDVPGVFHAKKQESRKSIIEKRKLAALSRTGIDTNYDVTHMLQVGVEDATAEEDSTQASRHGGQREAATAIQSGCPKLATPNAGADKGGNRSTRANEHGGLERRRRQSRSKEVEGVD